MCLIDPVCTFSAEWRDMLAHSLTHPLPPQSDEPAWRTARRTFVGASEMPAIVGESPWSSALDVWVAKVHGVADDTPSEAIEMGRLVEPMLRSDFAARHGVSVEVCPTVRHRAFGFGAATPDGDVVTDGRLLEIKNVGARSVARWQGDEPPPYVRIQSQWQMEVFDRDECVVLALLGGSQRREFLVKRDRELGAAMLELAERFWQRVEEQTPPEDFNGPTARASLLAAYPRILVDTLEPATDEVVKLAAEYASLGETEKRAKDERDKIAAALQTAIGARAGLLLPGGGKVTWSERAGSPDHKGNADRLATLARELGATPEQVAATHQMGRNTRVLTVRLGKPAR